MRYEKELVRLQWQECPVMETKTPETKDGVKIIWRKMAANTVRCGAEEVLVLTVYFEDGEPEKRFFLNADQYGMQTYQTQHGYNYKEREPGRIYECGIENAVENFGNSWYCSRETQFYTDAASTAAAVSFLGDIGKNDVMTAAMKRQREIRAERIRKKDERQKDKLRRAFEGVDPAVPEEFKTFCEDVAMEEYRYFFYEYTGRKVQRGICSYCMKTESIAGIRERKYGVCPSCGEKVYFFSAKKLENSYGRHHKERATFFLPVNAERFAARVFDVGLHLKMKNGKLEKDFTFYETYRVFFDAEGKKRDMYTAGENVKIKVDGLSEVNLMGAWVDKTYIAPMHLETLRKRMKIWTPIEETARHGLEAAPEKLWRIAKEKPETEYLAKTGLWRLAAYELSSEIGALLPGKKLSQRLGIPAESLDRVRAANPGGKELRLIRGMLNAGKRLTEEDMKDIVDMKIGPEAEAGLQRMMVYGTAHKALRYIRQQAEQTKGDAIDVIQLWKDYMRMAESIGKNMQDRSAAMPKALKAAHDETMLLVDEKKNEIINKKMRNTAEKLKDLVWEFDGLMIRPAESQGELFAEGEALNHCVGRGGYAKKMGNGESAIFFIRKKPDEPYVTLELSLKTFEKIQCYGKGDTWPGKKVDNFVRKWIKEIVKPNMENKGRKTA